MTRREYLTHLRKQAGESRPASGCVDPRTPVLPVTSPATQGALARIMAQTGFSTEQIADRFPQATSREEPQEQPRRALG